MVVYYSLVYGKGSLLVREKKRFVGLMFVGRFQAIYRVEKDGLESKPIITSLGAIRHFVEREQMRQYSFNTKSSSQINLLITLL